MFFFVKSDSVEEGTPLTVDSFEKLPFISAHEKYCFLERSADFQFNAAFKLYIEQDLIWKFY